MSVIAAHKIGNNIYFAADSIVSKDDLKRTDFRKLKQITPCTVVGGCGGAEELALFYTFATEVEFTGSTVRDVQDYMREFSLFKEHYLDTRSLDNEYIIAHKDHLFEVQGMFVKEVHNYVAIGAGEAYALSALYLGHDVETAINVACNFCKDTSLPIQTAVIHS